MIDQMKNLKEQDDRITSNIDINSIVQEYQNEEDNMYAGSSRDLSALAGTWRAIASHSKKTVCRPCPSGYRLI